MERTKQEIRKYKKLEAREVATLPCRNRQSSRQAWSGLINELKLPQNKPRKAKREREPDDAHPPSFLSSLLFCSFFSFSFSGFIYYTEY